ncbi:hypothetical protein, partial [Escherichia coli]|uniref:hypothetical protein n=1 Tax=Escherichia coli TaxID=562 RepID=UPI0029167696
GGFFGTLIKLFLSFFPIQLWINKHGILVPNLDGTFLSQKCYILFYLCVKVFCIVARRVQQRCCTQGATGQTYVL